MGSVSAHKVFIHCGHRRAVYRRKYRMDDPPQTNNRVVAAITRSERMHASLFRRNTGALLDPAFSPAMYAVAERALRDFHDGMASGRITCQCHDGPDDPFTRMSPDDPALYVHFIGSSTAFVVRGPKLVDAFDRATRRPGTPRRGVDYFVPMVQLLFELQGEFGDTGCNVRVAQSCTKHTQFLPYRAGAVLMLFEVCSGCLAYAQEAAKTGHELSVMEARAGIDGGL